ncbi:MAG: hypothetical protein AAGF85_21575 [Bacteroidota bacterium]
MKNIKFVIMMSFISVFVVNIVIAQPSKEPVDLDGLAKKFQNNGEIEYIKMAWQVTNQISDVDKAINTKIQLIEIINKKIDEELTEVTKTEPG